MRDFAHAISSLAYIPPGDLVGSSTLPILRLPVFFVPGLPLGVASKPSRRSSQQAASVLPPSDSTSTLPALAALTSESARSNQRTAKRAAQIIVEDRVGFVVPTARQRVAILQAFAREEQVVYGKAFDIVQKPDGMDLDDPESIHRFIDKLLVCEIKSTNNTAVKKKFAGYFFAITAGEMLTAQSLGERYRFVFVNTLTREYMDLTLREI
ncbi:MAG: hypothetical protein ACKV2T_37010, partial [Kofleriaceae bacterium]